MKFHNKFYTHDRFCPAPWHSLLVNWKGDVTYDSQFARPLGNIKRQSLMDMWNSETACSVRRDFLQGGASPLCIKCDKKELSAGASRRQFFWDIMTPLLKTDQFHLDAKPDIYFLEVNFSNKCNLKCRMCSSESSTAWISEEKALSQMTSGAFRTRDTGKYSLDITSIRNLLQDSEAFQNLSYISLKGGEPFLDEINCRFLDHIIGMGCASRCVLDITTNGTIINDRWSEYLKHFKEIKLHVSIEAVGDLYQYIRGGNLFKIQQLEDNLKSFDRLQNTRVIFATVSMAYTVFDQINLWNWYKNIRKSNYEIFFRNTVVEPRCLNVHVLPLDIRKQAYDLIEQGLDKELRERKELGLTWFQKGLLRQDYYSPKEEEKQKERFIQFTRDLDDLRKTKITDYVPQLEPLFS